MCINLVLLPRQLILRLCVNRKNKTIATSGFVKAGISQFNVLININHGSETEVGNQSASGFFFSFFALKEDPSLHIQQQQKRRPSGIHLQSTQVQ